MKKFFEELMRNKEKPLGIFMNCGCPEFLESAGLAGYQFVIIDNEHGGWSGETNAHMIRAAEAVGMASLVRISDLNETAVRKALDIGASGIVVPNVSSLEAARTAISYALFAPEGVRGACPCVRANGYGSGDAGLYFTKSNKEVAIVLLIEGKGGIASFDDILELDGVKYVFFGPDDMSVSLGYPGQPNHPEVISAIESMIKRAQAKGVYTGMVADSAEKMWKWFDIGIDFGISVGDLGLFYKICKEMVDSIRLHSS